MFCAQCGDKVTGKPIRQMGEIFCSVECANLAAGIDPEEEGVLVEEEDLEEFYPEEDE